MSEPTTVDYAIVGGGVAGLYTAWRILNGPEGAKATVRVYEASDRVGGRLLTWNPAGKDQGLRAELGGMRFFKEQQLVTALIDEIGLKDQRIPFYTAGPGLIWSFRGYRCAAGDVPSATSHYRLRPGEDISSFELVNSVIVEVLRDNGVTDVPTSWQGWDEIKPRLFYRGQPLWTVGFWNLLYDLLSPEAYRYIVDSFGYYTPNLNWNAAEAFQSVSLDFTTNPSYETLSQGYDQVPKMLAAAIEKTKDGKQIIKHGARLDRFELTGDDATSTVLLTFADDKHPPVKARKLILALPRRSLDLLAPTPTFDSRSHQMRTLLDTARPYPAFKLFLFYPDGRWWERAGFGGAPIEHGRSVTDMPIRQTYYMRPDACETNPNCDQKFGLIMASYDDSIAVDFWEGLEHPPAEMIKADEMLPMIMEDIFRVLTPDLLAETPKFDPPPQLHTASPLMIRHARQQLALLHGMPEHEVPTPKWGAYADWSLDPFGGGWHFWEPQVDVLDMMPKIRTPLGDKPVYLVGEAYSGAQGWVEGALTTAERVVHDNLGIPRPKWMDHITYFGP